MAKAKGKISQEEQSARFVRAAAEAGVDKRGKAFARAFKKIVTPKARTRTKGAK